MKMLSKILVLTLALMFIATGAMAEPLTLVVGTNPEFPPFEYVGDSGEIEGIDADIIYAIAKMIDENAVVTIEALDFDALVPSLGSGKIDVAIAGMSVTEDRLKSVDFTVPYFDAVQAIIVKEGSDIATEADLDGKKIGVQLGTTGDLYVSDNCPTAEISRFNKGIDAVQDVASGRLDCVVIDAAPADVFAKNAGLIVLDEKLNSGNEQYAIALPKGNEALLEQFNDALSKLIADGTIDAIVAKYMAE